MILLLLALLVPAGLVAPAFIGPDPFAVGQGLFPQNDGETGVDAPDECQPNVPSPVELAFRETHGTLEPLADTDDVYAFTLNAGDRIRIVMDPGEDLPPISPIPNYDLELLDPECAVLKRSGHRLGEPEVIDFDILEDGVYNVRVHMPRYLGTPLPILTLHDAPMGRFFCDPGCHQFSYDLSGSLRI